MVLGREQLKEWMHRRRFLQVEAAEYIGIDVTHLNKILNTSHTPGLTTAIKIERKTGIPVEAWVASEIGETVSVASKKAQKEAE
jgi:transcriptional regulator with XRE-family HTH domain